MKEFYLERLKHVEKLATGSKLSRLFHHPLKYIYAIILKNVLYPVVRKEVSVSTMTFTGDRMKVLLPASTDIYLTGGKSHQSEIRLARFLIHHLEPGDIFWDIGAHYGYFSLIASQLVGSGGQVLSFEPSPVTFNVLRENAGKYSQVTIFNHVVSDKKGKTSFFEMSNLYSEYNTTDIAQFKNEKWFAREKMNEVVIESARLDDMTEAYPDPGVIKIDVEGGELAVIRGGLQLFGKRKPVIIMEFLEPGRYNLPHRQAAELLASLGYRPYKIMNDGRLSAAGDIEEHLRRNNLQSDNIVFR